MERRTTQQPPTGLRILGDGRSVASTEGRFRRKTIQAQQASKLRRRPDRSSRFERVGPVL
jgi:hypothetical protein